MEFTITIAKIVTEQRTVPLTRALARQIPMIYPDELTKEDVPLASCGFTEDGEYQEFVLFNPHGNGLRRLARGNYSNYGMDRAFGVDFRSLPRVYVL